MFIQKIRDNEEHVAGFAILAILKKYTGEMKHNLEHFSEITEELYSQIPEEMRTEDKFLKLASHKGEAVASEPVNALQRKSYPALRPLPQNSEWRRRNYCRMMIDTYSNDYLSKVFGTKHGPGASEYIVKAFRIISENNCTENN